MVNVFTKKINRKYMKEHPNRLLILRTKHGDDIYSVPTDDVLYKFMVKIVQMRHKEGWYNNYLPTPEKPDFDEEDIDTLPASMQFSAHEKLAEFRQKAKIYASQFEERTLLGDALAGNGEAAYEFMEYRNDYEYEDFRLEIPKTFEEVPW